MRCIRPDCDGYGRLTYGPYVICSETCGRMLADDPATKDLWDWMYRYQAALRRYEGWQYYEVYEDSEDRHGAYEELEELERHWVYPPFYTDEDRQRVRMTGLTIEAEDRHGDRTVVVRSVNGYVVCTRITCSSKARIMYLSEVPNGWIETLSPHRLFCSLRCQELFDSSPQAADPTPFVRPDMALLDEYDAWLSRVLGRPVDTKELGWSRERPGSGNYTRLNEQHRLVRSELMRMVKSSEERRALHEVSHTLPA